MSEEQLVGSIIKTDEPTEWKHLSLVRRGQLAFIRNIKQWMDVEIAGHVIAGGGFVVEAYAHAPGEIRARAYYDGRTRYGSIVWDQQERGYVFTACPIDS